MSTESTLAGSPSLNSWVPQFATYKNASKYFSIQASGLPLKSPKEYSLAKLVGVMWARVE